jgi:uncharacterized protein (DUF924 family)
VSPDALPTKADVLSFWRAAGPAKWFSKDDAFDAEIRTRFSSLYAAAAALQLTDWEREPEGAVALAIVLDQFPRNMFRGSARMYATDPLALAVAERALARGFDQRLSEADRQFLYLPFMHSEDLSQQERCVVLYRALGEPELLRYADLHADIVRRFGRFPHRNALLGRATTPEEDHFLASGGFAG